MFGVILAGGSGSRLWPLSRELYPKQLLNLYAEKSLLQSTFERLNKFIPSENIISVTNSKHHANVKMQLGKLSENSIILSEPISKNTAPAIALAIKYIIENSDLDETVLIVPSDLLIEDNERFITSVKEAEKFIEQDKIVTFGVRPTYPETGFGYIKYVDGSVVEFTEKPNYETAEQYIKDGGYFWNSGIFMFKVSTIIKELEHYCPEISSIIKNINCTDKTISFTEFEKMPSISIDYALMEKSKNIAMVELVSNWKDLGSWQSIYEVSPKDKNNNVFVGHVLDKGSKNSFVYSSSKLVATIGLEDTVVIETEDAILACKKDKTQEVKQIYETLKEQHDGTQMVHKTVYRPWGFYTVIAEGKGFQTKLIHVNVGQKLSVQSHNHRSEHWVVLSGMAKVVLEGKEHILSPGHSIDIAVKAIHSLQNPFDEDIEIIEVQKGDILSEDDIIRYEDMYGRA
ncbi:MAG: mannose-1-phosphate guanylyltransferase/mannose-6-phosphate isomerase [Candidatus Gastranaerophilales bacterium]|nr:mannose-1-phosphate guanylyltransferase/mannose-6-phosphate isomerase [Candidatus Gastranaerophilales bacterium]